jgi:hypothetical protein
VISLADYSVEKSFVLAVPHRFLIGEPESIAAPAAPRPAPASAGRGTAHPEREKRMASLVS